MTSNVKNLVLGVMVLTFALTQAGVAQDLADTDLLTNDDVIEMVEAGLSAEIVLARLESCGCQFTTSTSAIVALAKAGVPNDVIYAMVADANKKVEAPPVDVAQPTVSLGPTPSETALVAPTSFVPVKDQVVTVLIPADLLRYDTIRIRDSKSIYVAEISETASGARVWGQRDWKRSDFPFMAEARIEKVGDKKNYFEVEMATTIMVFKLRFIHPYDDLGALIGSVALPGYREDEVSKAYLASRYAFMAKDIFTGPIIDVEQSAQLALVEFVHRLILDRELVTSATLGSETYRDNVYLKVDLGQDTLSYNTNQLDQPARVRRVVNEKMLVILKAFNAPVEEALELYGIKVEFEIPYRDFLSESTDRTEELSIYAPSELIKRFADADITSQEFIDGCVVIVGGNRVGVDLS